MAASASHTLAPPQGTRASKSNRPTGFAGQAKLTVPRRCSLPCSRSLPPTFLNYYRVLLRRASEGESNVGLNSGFVGLWTSESLAGDVHKNSVPQGVKVREILLMCPRESNSDQRI